MRNNKTLKKKILYRSTHRGTKEMDILLGKFVKKHISILKNKDLNDLMELLNVEDDIIQKWYFEKKSEIPILNSKVSSLLKNIKI